MFKVHDKVILKEVDSKRDIAVVIQTEKVPACKFCNCGDAIYVRGNDYNILHVHKNDIKPWLGGRR